MSKTYPVRSSNGSTIIVYGHEQGLRLVWKGGKPLKAQSNPADASKSNGGRNEAIIIDLSDEENDKPDQIEDHPLFEDEEQEYDPKEPYDSIVQSLDLPLGVEVLHLAFPPLPIDLHRRSYPALLSQKITVALTGSDCSTRIVTFPLTPPSHELKARSKLGDSIVDGNAGRSLFGEQMIILSSGIRLQGIPKGVSISLTAASSDDPDDIDMDAEDVKNRTSSSRHSSRSRSRSRLAKDKFWDLLVASHSRDLSGLLFIYRIPLTPAGTSISKELQTPWRIQYLASPAVSIEFSPALYPSPLHSHILVAEETGAVRTLDCLPQSDSMQASWLVCMYNQFENTATTRARRTSILSSRWILGGKAILVLQADGKWGIWDHEGAGPKSTKASNAAGKAVKGSLTSFAIEGWIGDSRKSKTLLKTSSGKGEGRSKLAPMTPSTRKKKQDVLFTGPNSQSDGPIRGGIDVTPIHDASESLSDDESVLLWHGSNIVVIPSILTHWQTKIRGSGNLFGTGAKGEPKLVNNVQLGGESCTEVTLLSTQDQKEPQILVTGEKRLFILAPPLTKPEILAKPEPRPLDSAMDVDQQMLESGELDINGMDRILNTMTASHTSRRNSQLSTTTRSRKGSQGLLL